MVALCQLEVISAVIHSDILYSHADKKGQASFVCEKKTDEPTGKEIETEV